MVRRRVYRVLSLVRGPSPPPAPIPPLHLQPGEYVRVKLPEEIRKTLARGVYDRLFHIPAPMDQVGGKIFRVLKRTDWFYEECRDRIIKSRDTVVLDRAFCNGSQHHQKGHACDRSCLLFWKEAWLERVTESEGQPAGVVEGPETQSPQGIISSIDPALGKRRVRIRSIEEIEATLDEKECCGDLPFIRSMMEPYCGREFSVRGPLEHVHDEQNVWFSRFSHAMILEGVYCTGAPIAEGGRCDHSCSLFWHEAWVEEISIAIS